ncbi:lytic transglycosylase domain-containing protein [Campylobacter fetus]|uniref:lytic transglycosylase domain-containing protein n=1 Tax=Campylobacter fetus TaxID=196 RepID=UPI000B069F81|nr:lytic transglycosylase domain-containing protein [Campylobacter fetus]WKW21808.1 lytic transglycosylase domain-containing protein [Campylobacter fetus subsp. venerealis]WKW28088.1 lytic transglycosylase domain-containing protein [Campylobacter fetus subsp. venerealis bv. intermedius]WKW30213.1 lytic transglycosylase domain-containing protein [Campylobacter fetus subsp. venerealis bv. intermedius]
MSIYKKATSIKYIDKIKRNYIQKILFCSVLFFVSNIFANEINLSIIDQCKNQNIDTEIIKQIIEVESKYQQFAINVNKVGSFTLKTKKEAKALADFYIKQGYSVDIGLMQFNSSNLKEFSYSIDEILEPCNNIKAGSDIFYLAYESTDPNLDKNERINKALSVYNTGNQQLGFKNGYVAKFDIQNSNNIEIQKIARQSNTKLSLVFKPYNFTTKDTK